MVPHNDCRRGTAIRCDPHLGYSPPDHGGDTPFERLSRTARSWHLLQTSQERTAPVHRLDHIAHFSAAIRAHADGFLTIVTWYIPPDSRLAKPFDRARGALASATDLMWSYTGRTNGAPGGRQGVGSRLLTPQGIEARTITFVHPFFRR